MKWLHHNQKESESYKSVNNRQSRDLTAICSAFSTESNSSVPMSFDKHVSCIVATITISEVIFAYRQQQYRSPRTTPWQIYNLTTVTLFVSASLNMISACADNLESFYLKSLTRVASEASEMHVFESQNDGVS